MKFDTAEKVPTTEHLFAFYGSLRENQYNWAYMLRPSKDVTFVETTQVEGYTLFPVGSYPVVLETALLPEDKKINGPIVVDVFAIKDLNLIKRIHMMEVFAGYRGVELTTTSGKKCVMYVGIPEYFSSIIKSPFRKPLSSGDWSNR